jgi:hypothetical protein
MITERHLEDELPAMTDAEKIVAMSDEGMADSVADAYEQLVAHGYLKRYTTFSRGYSRRSGETSTGFPFDSITAAIDDALACMKSRGVVNAWVRGVDPETWALSDVLWSAK